MRPSHVEGSGARATWRAPRLSRYLRGLAGSTGGLGECGEGVLDGELAGQLDREASRAERRARRGTFLRSKFESNPSGRTDRDEREAVLAGANVAGRVGRYRDVMAGGYLDLVTVDNDDARSSDDAVYVLGTVADVVVRDRVCVRRQLDLVDLKRADTEPLSDTLVVGTRRRMRAGGWLYR